MSDLTLFTRKKEIPFWQMTPEEALNKRLELLVDAKRDIKLQKRIMDECKEDVVKWVNWFVVTYDPRRKDMMYVPFSLMPFQMKYLRWRREIRAQKKNGLCEKSRDSGISWVNVGDQFHAWLFEWGFAGSFGSMKETLVDQRGNPKSLFEKLRIIYRHLPRWMLPPNFNSREHDNYMKLINPYNGSVIVGEVGRGMGRGGRSSVYDWDETAFAEHPEENEAAISGNTEVTFYTSTVKGHNFFYKKKCHLAASDPNCIFRVHWRDDPRKDEDWYRTMCAKYDPIIVASEIDIDYGASVVGIFLPNAWVLAAVAIDLPISQGEQIVASLDVAGEGSNLCVLTFRKGSKVIHIEHWNGIHTSQSAYKTAELCRIHNVAALNFDADGLGEGVASTLADMGVLPFDVNPLQGAKAASSYWWEGERRHSKDKFANSRAEWWGLMKERFKKTYDYATGVSGYEPDEMIDIPNHAILIQQLSQPKGKWANNGKILIESKSEMIARGISSPDFADSLAFSFAPRMGF